jgi:CubicO group peptidase (beta-lactamase class C family)
MRQLLGHLGGMPHYQDGIIASDIEYKQKHPFEDVVVALDKFKETPLVSTPGTSYHYSTHGFILASAVIQRAGEEQFARQVEKRIAKTLKMHSLQPDYQWKSRSKRAIGLQESKRQGCRIDEYGRVLEAWGRWMDFEHRRLGKVCSRSYG